VRPIPGPSNQLIVGLAFHPDGSRLATGETSGAIRLWNTATLAQEAVLEGGTTQSTFLVFEPSGALLIAAFDDGAIRIWDPSTGRLMTTLTGHGAGVYWLELRRDGRQLASAALEAAPRLWALPRYVGTPDQLTDLVRCRVRWRLLDGMPAPADPPADCP
jgi:WD40 repeat protein